MSQLAQTAIARRYRPSNFQSVVGQDVTLRALRSALDTKRIHHAYLFTGTRGVGKTTLARILAKCLNCEEGISSTPCERCASCIAINEGTLVDLIEVDAASRTKVEDTRELLDNVQYLPTHSRFKIYLIDEVHMLSGHSFNALLKTLEEPPLHVKFILATTDPQKLPITILSRCLQFHLQCLSFKEIVEHLEQVLIQEKISFEKAALPLLARAAQGSMRDALSLLEQAIAYGQGDINAAECRALLGLTEQGKIEALFEAIIENNASKALQCVGLIARTAPDFSAVLIELLTLIHHVAIAQHAPDALEESLLNYNEILAWAPKISATALQLLYQIGLLGQRDLPLAPTPPMGFEMIILRMLAFQPVELAKQTPNNALKGLLQNNNNNAEAPSETASAIVHETIHETLPTSNVKSVTLGISPTVGVSSTVELSSTIEPSSMAWSELVSKLKVNGFTKELASHCSVIEWSQERLHLSLDKSQQALLNDRSLERLQKALHETLGKKVHLKITQDNAIKPTPAFIAKKNQETSLNKAHHLIEQDPVVQDLIHRFDAKVEELMIPPQPLHSE